MLLFQIIFIIGASLLALLLLIGIISIIIAVLDNKGNEAASNLIYTLEDFTKGVCIFLAAVGAIFSIMGGIGWKVQTEHYNTLVTEVLSISRSSSSEGSFALGCGSVKETSYYFYYYQADKGIKLGKVKAEKTYIVETNEKTPSLYNIKEYGDMNDYYNLYVPEGTIVLTYVLD